ncbi:MAG: hypothetical protein GY765_28845 [bacterium]|nr:hypothetical protein [bacterium]
MMKARKAKKKLTLRKITISRLEVVKSQEIRGRKLCTSIIHDNTGDNVYSAMGSV